MVLVSQIDLVKVFVASPSDVADERAIVKEIIEEFNALNGQLFKVRCEFLGWDTHSFAAFGNDGQDVINKQISEYDIFIGIMWSKIGTATPRASSGTIEEFEIALDKHKSSPYGLSGGFYFKSDDIPQDKLTNPYDYQAVLKFRKEVEKNGLYKQFNSSSFEKFFRSEFNRIITDYLNKSRKKKEEQVLNLSTSSSIKQTSSQLSDGQADVSRADDENLQLLDYRVQLDDGFAAVNSATLLINDAILLLNDKMTNNSTKLTKLNSSGKFDTKKAYEIVGEVADQFDDFSRVVEEQMPIIKNKFSTALNASTAIQIYILENDGEKSETFSDNQKASQLLQAELIGTRESMQSFTDSIESIPPLSSKMMKSRNRILGSLRSLDEAFSNNITELGLLIKRFD